jgi:signal transduction histidine kinase
VSSIRRRLGLGLLLGVATLVGLLYLVTAGALRQLAEEQMASRLEHDTETLLAALDSTARPPSLAEARIHPIYLRPFSGHYYQVELAATRLRSRSLWDQQLEPGEAAPGSPLLSHAHGPLDQPLLMRTAAFEKSGASIRITVAEDLSDLEAQVDRFQVRFAALSLAFLLLALLLQQAILARSLAPLAESRRQLERLERGEIGKLDDAVPDEIRPLVAAFNRALSTMQRRLNRSREAAGNLAHSLKRPLALITQVADGAGVLGDSERAGLAAQSARLRELIDSELRRARIAGQTTAGERVDLTRVLSELVHTVERLHAPDAPGFHLDAPDRLPFAGDRQDLLELFGNLLDNAAKWASSRVDVSVAAGDSAVRVRVDDDGPGIPADQRTRLLGRGARLDESVEGHGLGLGIAADIADEYGGGLSLSDAATLGGLRVEVRLPHT